MAERAESTSVNIVDDKPAAMQKIGRQDTFERSGRKSGGTLDRGRSSRFIKGTTIAKPSLNDGSGFLGLIMAPINLLLLCLPFGLAADVFNWGALVTFWLNFVALIPLAKILGDATEELAAGLKNDMLAGLLNATFGNAVEMVIMVQMLRVGLVDVVKLTLLGSVLSNLLLVLGMSFFFGGFLAGGKNAKGENLRSSIIADVGGEKLADVSTRVDRGSVASDFVVEKVQKFSTMNAMVNTSMLLLSCLSLSLVTVFYMEMQKGEQNGDIADLLMPVSRMCSAIIMAAYVAFVFFQLVTHREAMAEQDPDEGDDDDGEVPVLSIRGAIAVMLLTTVVVAFCSDILVSSLQGVVENAHMSTHFIGIILLPIVGNACEHASAVRFAIMDKPGLSIGIAIGSSTQISLFVVPFSVLVGWAINQPMDLNFGALNTTVMAVSVIVVLSIVVDGTANWLQGYLLISAYLIIAVLYWHLPDKVSAEV